MRRNKRVAVPTMETDPSRIQQLSREREDENWEFRSWLKQHAPDDIDGVVKALSQKYFDIIGSMLFQPRPKFPVLDDIDGVVKALSQKYFALIDCTQCANCCRSLHIEFK